MLKCRRDFFNIKATIQVSIHHVGGNVQLSIAGTIQGRRDVNNFEVVSLVTFIEVKVLKLSFSHQVYEIFGLNVHIYIPGQYDVFFTEIEFL